MTNNGSHLPGCDIHADVIYSGQISIGVGIRNMVKTKEGGTFQGPLKLTFYCPTQGASLGYRINDDSRWQLYAGPVTLAKSSTRISVKAIRYGYRESDILSATFNVTE